MYRRIGKSTRFSCGYHFVFVCSSDLMLTCMIEGQTDLWVFLERLERFTIEKADLRLVLCGSCRNSMNKSSNKGRRLIPIPCSAKSLESSSNIQSSWSRFIMRFVVCDWLSDQSSFLSPSIPLLTFAPCALVYSFKVSGLYISESILQMILGNIPSWTLR